MAYSTTNPYTGELIQTYPNATNEEVGQAITQAHNAFLNWRETSFEFRASVLQKAADLLRQNKENMQKFSRWRWAN